LADAYRLTNLRDASLEAIVSQLTPENVLLEVFSEFNGKYEAVCDQEVAYLLKHWDKVKISPAWNTLLTNDHISTRAASHKRAWGQIGKAVSLTPKVANSATSSGHGDNARPGPWTLHDYLINLRVT